MGNLLYTFEPVNETSNWSILLMAMVGIAALGGLVYLLKGQRLKLDKNRRLVLAMLCFFVFIISISTAFFTFWSTLKIQEVSIYQNGIETSYGSLLFTDISKVYFHQDKQPSLFDAAKAKKSVRFLVIEAEGRSHVLSELNYDIELIVRRLEEVMKKAE